MRRHVYRSEHLEPAIRSESAANLFASSHRHSPPRGGLEHFRLAWIGKKEQATGLDGINDFIACSPHLPWPHDVRQHVHRHYQLERSFYRFMPDVQTPEAYSLIAAQPVLCTLKRDGRKIDSQKPVTARCNELREHPFRTAELERSGKSTRLRLVEQREGRPDAVSIQRICVSPRVWVFRKECVRCRAIAPFVPYRLTNRDPKVDRASYARRTLQDVAQFGNDSCQSDAFLDVRRLIPQFVFDHRSHHPSVGRRCKATTYAHT